MTRKEAILAIYEVINSGIVSDELSDKLSEVCDCICNNDFINCEVDPRCESGYPNYCEGCGYLNE